MRHAVLAVLFAFAPAALARAPEPSGVLKHKPPKFLDEERPVVVEARLAPQGSDFILHLEFDRVPWGDECKTRCANATFLIDTDGDPQTGLQQGGGKPQTGADLAVTVQGLKDYSGESSASYVKVKVRQLADDDRILDDGDLIAELDHRRDRERIELDAKQIRVVVDASSGTLPVGKTCRFVYLAPMTRPVSASCKGMLAKGGGKVDVLKKGQPVNSRGRKHRPRGPAGG